MIGILEGGKYLVVIKVLDIKLSLQIEYGAYMREIYERKLQIYSLILSQKMIDM
jgi:hypothetical protein